MRKVASLWVLGVYSICKYHIPLKGGSKPIRSDNQMKSEEVHHNSLSSSSTMWLRYDRPQSRIEILRNNRDDNSDKFRFSKAHSKYLKSVEPLS